MRWLVIGLIAALGISGQERPTVTDTERLIVFPPEHAASLVVQCSRQVPEPVQGTWVPDSTMIAKIEAALAAAFVQALDQAEVPTRSRHPLREYYRQYGGLVLGGRRTVYLNAFHQSHLELPTKLTPPRAPIDWRSLAVNVCDGWVNYFGATYATDLGKIDTLVFNGRAMLPNSALEPTAQLEESMNALRLSASR